MPERPALSAPIRLRRAVSLLALAGAVCLIAATPATVVSISLDGAAAGVDVDTSGASGWERHGPALLVPALAALALMALALRGARAAAVAVAVCGLTALGVALASDLPALDDVGSVADVYTEAEAGAGAGFFLETAGGVLLLAAGGLLALGMPGAGDGPGAGHAAAGGDTAAGGDATAGGDAAAGDDVTAGGDATARRERSGAADAAAES